MGIELDHAFIACRPGAPEAEVRSEQSRRTRLRERCSSPETADSPFGILFRSDGKDSPPPFPTWRYFPSYLPAGLAIEFAQGTSLLEPELIYLPFVRANKATPAPIRHELPFNRVRSLAVGLRHPDTLSQAALATQSLGMVRYFASDQPLLELHFEGSGKAAQLDLRPALPLVLRTDDRFPVS